ncbi:MAG: glycosyltransferase, partial [Planctomycetaceae bacterium]|nr:glycosyltransferase [Planctomycetaceae bacterium]
GIYYERPCLPSSAANIRVKLGLPADRHLYASPQSLFKFHPDDDNALRRILEADPLGLLIVIEGRVAEWTARLKSRWQTTLGILADRIVFLPAMPHLDYLQLLKACDVILDPLHFGGGNSSYEALAMGTPIVTMPSHFLRGRITAGLYRKMQMTDCIADSVEEYIDLAVKLATNQEFRQEISRKISEAVSVLFEDIHEVHSLEVALMECAARRR